MELIGTPEFNYLSVCVNTFGNIVLQSLYIFRMYSVIPNEIDIIHIIYKSIGDMNYLLIT